MIEDRQYAVIEGPIANLVLDQKILKTDPISTFDVGNSTFEYGRFSINEELVARSQGGPLIEGRKVALWYHNGTILKIYAD